MGCVPSREFHETSEAICFIRRGSLQLTRLPLTPHFFPSPDCLAFRQLYNCRNSQSAKFGFTPHGSTSCRVNLCREENIDKKVSEVECNGDSVRYFNRCDDDDDDNEWDVVCEEELEPDPSLPSPQHETEFVIQENDASVISGSHVRYDESKIKTENNKTKRMIRIAANRGNSFCYCTREELYRALVTYGTVPAMTNTNSEMISLYEEERAWRKAMEIMRQHRDCQPNKCKQENREENIADRVMEQMPQPPRRFLWGLPYAVLTVLGSDDAVLRELESATIPRDGFLHLIESNDTLFLVSRLNDKYILPPTPVSVVGCDSLLPAVCRGTSWLRGYEGTSERERKEDEEIESFPPTHRPPVLVICHFCGAAICPKAFHHVRMEGFACYARQVQMMGIEELFMRPMWHLGLASNVSLLHIIAEIRQVVQATAFPTGMAVSVRGNRLLFRIQENAARAMCNLLCTCGGCLAPEMPFQQVVKKTVLDNSAFDYGGRIGVHPKTGELCVPRLIHELLQKRQRETEVGEAKDADGARTTIVFIVVAPRQTKMSLSVRAKKKEAAGGKEDTLTNVFCDGDLITYDYTRKQWMRPAITVETLLLSWVKRILENPALCHDDSKWLRDGKGRIVQQGRFCIWGVVHDGLLFFFGVIPKFVKEQKKRQLRKKRRSLHGTGGPEPLHQEKQQQHVEDEPRQDTQVQAVKRQPVLFKYHGDVARYFRNGCFAWNPYGNRL